MSDTKISDVDIVRALVQSIQMRDDLHKSVPRPPKVQRWVKQALREADAITGRSREALVDALHDACKREISPEFRSGVDRLLTGLPNLFGPISSMLSARDLGGAGGPLEDDVLSRAQRLSAEGKTNKEAFRQGVAEALRARIESDIRAAEPVLREADDPRAQSGLEQMNKDAHSVDTSQFAETALSTKQGSNSKGPRSQVSPDEDLLGRSSKPHGESK